MSHFPCKSVLHFSDAHSSNIYESLTILIATKLSFLICLKIVLPNICFSSPVTCISNHSDTFALQSISKPYKKFQV